MLLTVPKRYPIQIKVVGLVNCNEFQRLKYFLQQLYESNKKIFWRPQIRALMEFDWMEYITHLCREVGGKSWMRKSEVVVFWNNQLVGDDCEFHNTLSTVCQLHMYWPLELSFQELGKQERVQYFSRNPDRSYIFFDVEYEGREGRLLFELYSDLLPATCVRFMLFCLTHPMKEKNHSFRGTVLKRICKRGWLQGGDLKIRCKKFKDENYAVGHDRMGVLSLCNRGKKNTNGTQFFITFQPSPWMDGFYVAIGQLIEGYNVLLDLESFRTTYEHPDNTITIANCGVLPYGRGLPVRNEFVHHLSKEIAKKWKEFSKKIVSYKQSGSAIIVTDGPLPDLGFEVEDVDTNNNYLMAKAIKIAPDREDEPDIYAYILQLLIDRVTSAIQLHDIHSDVIDLEDVSSSQYYLDRYLKNFYSRPRSSDHHFQQLLSLCSSCDFYGKAKRLKEQLHKSDMLKNFIEQPEDATTEPDKLSFTSVSHKSKDLSEKRIYIEEGSGKVSTSYESIIAAIDAAFKNLEIPEDVAQDDKEGAVEGKGAGEEEGEEGELHFDPIAEIIEELLTRITGEIKPTKRVTKKSKTLSKTKIIRQIAIKFLKSLLLDALKIHKKNISKKKRGSSILKQTSDKLSILRTTSNKLSQVHSNIGKNNSKSNTWKKP